MDQLEQSLKKLDEAVEQQAKSQPAAVRLMTHPGVGPVTSLAFVLTIGPVNRFPRSRAGGELSGTESARAQLGRTAASGIDQQARQPDDALAAGGSRTHGGAFRSAVATHVSTLKVSPGGGVAKVAIARKLAVRMYWMLRNPADYAQLVRLQDSPGGTLVGKRTSLVGLGALPP